MKTYKFEWLNNGLEITPEKIEWYFAGFDIRGGGVLTVEANLITKNSTFSVTLKTIGQPTDRSDKAIDALMYKLLEPYEV